MRDIKEIKKILEQACPLFEWGVIDKGDEFQYTARLTIVAPSKERKTVYFQSQMTYDYWNNERGGVIGFIEATVTMGLVDVIVAGETV